MRPHPFVIIHNIIKRNIEKLHGPQCELDMKLSNKNGRRVHKLINIKGEKNNKRKGKRRGKMSGTKLMLWYR